MRIPVTDAFDEKETLESLEVKLTPEQLNWLKEKANDRGLSLNHVIRATITAQIRADADEVLDPSTSEEMSSPASSDVSGDGMPPSPADISASDQSDRSADHEEEAEDASDSSIVDSLRTASERLQDLTEETASEESDMPDTLSRLRARFEDTSDSEDTASEEESNNHVMVDTQTQSMFDMMDE